MKIPSNWNTVFSNVFYDKTIDVLKREDTFDNEGGLISTVVYDYSFNGNVRFDNLKQVQEDLGLVESINIAITTQVRDLPLNSIFQYQDKKYLVTDAVPFDSHLMVVGKKWKYP